jgi:hypothetical protein
MNEATNENEMTDAATDDRKRNPMGANRVRGRRQLIAASFLRRGVALSNGQSAYTGKPIGGGRVQANDLSTYRY